VTAAVHPILLAGYAAVFREVSTAFERHGLRIKPVNKTMAEFLEAEKQGAVDLYLGRWAADYPDPDTFAHILHTREGHIGRICGNPEIDRLIGRGRTETTPAARHGIYRQIEEVIAGEVVLIPLFHEQAYRFARPEVEGLSVSFGVPTVVYENLRIKG
jgi:ABC-type oligopeptide transport system substrate-binding subunit